MNKEASVGKQTKRRPPLFKDGAGLDVGGRRRRQRREVVSCGGGGGGGALCDRNPIPT